MKSKEKTTFILDKLGLKFFYQYKEKSFRSGLVFERDKLDFQILIKIKGVRQLE